MSDTRIINIRSGECFDAQGCWRGGYVYIGRYNKAWSMRESVWANPFKLADYGNDVEQCLVDYRRRIERFLTEGSYAQDKAIWLANLRVLRGQTLVCWCKPNLCHGDVLIELIEKYCND